MFLSAQRCRATAWLGCVAAALAVPAVYVHGHNLLEIGRNSANQLKIDTHIHQPFPMPESIFGGIPGYAVASVGLATIFNDEPKHDLFTVAPQADIEVVVTGGDANIFLYNAQGTGPLPVGGTWPCGTHPFHMHPLWQINPGVPGASYGIQFRLHDRSGTHLDSEVFTLFFAPKCDGDATVNGTVDIDDLVRVITRWGSCSSCSCDADFNFDCSIDIDDLVTVITNWGGCR